MNQPTAMPPAQTHAHRPPAFRYEVDLQCPIEYTITHRIEPSPEVIELFHDLLTMLEPLMSKLTDAVDALAKSIDDATSRDQAAVADLNKQISDLQGQLANTGLTQAEEDALADRLADLQKKVDAFDAGGTTSTPTDGGVVPPPPPTDGGTNPVPTPTDGSTAPGSGSADGSTPPA